MQETLQVLHHRLSQIISGSESFARAHMAESVASMQAHLKDRLRIASESLVVQQQALFATYATSIDKEALAN